MVLGLTFDWAGTINVGIGALLGTAAGTAVTIVFQRRAAAHLDQVATAISRFLEQFAAVTGGEGVMPTFNLDEQGRPVSANVTITPDSLRQEQYVEETAVRRKEQEEREGSL